MPIVVLQHAASDPVARLGEVLRDHAFKLDIRRVDLAPSAGGKPVPADLDGVQGVISLGGPQNVGDASPWMAAELELLRAAHARQLPVIGVCLGAQLLAAALGGEVGPAARPEFGFAPVALNPSGQTDIIHAGIPWSSPQFHCHGHEVTKLPPEATALASSAGCKVQAFRAGLRSYGFQYHFECGREELEAFTRDPFGQKLMAGVGLSAGDARAQIDAHAAEYERLGARLCANLAGSLFPAISRTKSKG